MKALTYAKRISGIILAAALIFNLGACGGSNGNEENTDENVTSEAVLPGGSLSVPYTSQDSLNPYFTESVMNSVISSLVCRSLYTVDTSFTAVKDLALSESLTGLSLKVYIVPELVFSDLAPLGSEDIIYSFECAKSSPVYSGRLNGIASCEKGEDNSVIFTLTENDVNVLNALTFPIVKKGTAETAEFLPVGNGYYQFHQDGIRLTLKANLKYAGTLPEIGTIRLTDVKGNTSPSNLVSTGETDFFYSDLSDADITGVNSASTGVYLNNLVYLGVNHANVNLVLASFRQAISYAIDRQSLAENAFRGYARGTVVPVNISWAEYSSSKAASSLSLSADGSKTAQLFGQRGFGEGGIPLELTLLCNESNSFLRNTASIIAASLEPYNVHITIRLLDSDSLRRAVEAGEYDLYLGEVKIPVTMDISQFFTEDGSMSYGINLSNCSCDEAYFRYKSGEASLDSFLTAFTADMPFIPLLYRNGRLCYTRNITSEVQVTETALFSGINRWTFSE